MLQKARAYPHLGDAGQVSNPLKPAPGNAGNENNDPFKNKGLWSLGGQMGPMAPKKLSLKLKKVTTKFGNVSPKCSESFGKNFQWHVELKERPNLSLQQGISPLRSPTFAIILLTCQVPRK